MFWRSHEHVDVFVEHSAPPLLLPAELRHGRNGVKFAPQPSVQTNTRLARSISGRMKVSVRHVPVAFARLGLKSSETATHFPSKHPAQPCWNANLLLMEGLSTRQASAERGRIRHAGPPRLGDSPSRGLCTRCIFANFLAASLLVTYSWKVFGNAQRLLDAGI